jgi:hypothetical protein
MAASHSLLIRHLRLSGEEAQRGDDAGQDDDDEGATPGPTAGLPASQPSPGVMFGPARTVSLPTRRPNDVAERPQNGG